MIITNNKRTISITPTEKQKIKNYQKYTKTFHLQYIKYDNFDLNNSYARTLNTLHLIQNNKQSYLLHTQIPHLQKHSSNNNTIFQYNERDPVLKLNNTLITSKILKPKTILQHHKNTHQHN